MTTRQEQDENLIRDTIRLHKQTNVAETPFFMSVCNNYKRYGILSDGQRNAINKLRLVLERRAGTVSIPEAKHIPKKTGNCKMCKKPIGNYFKDIYQEHCAKCEQWMIQERQQNTEY